MRPRLPASFLLSSVLTHGPVTPLFRCLRYVKAIQCTQSSCSSIETNRITDYQGTASYLRPRREVQDHARPTSPTPTVPPNPRRQTPRPGDLPDWPSRLEAPSYARILPKPEDLQSMVPPRDTRPFTCILIRESTSTTIGIPRDSQKHPHRRLYRWRPPRHQSLQCRGNIPLDTWWQPVLRNREHGASAPAT
jgi:hypothetical protein